MIIIRRIIIALSLFVIIAVPVLSLAATDLIPCKDNCTFGDLLVLANRVIKFLLYTLAIPLCVITLVRAGFLMVLNSTNESKQTEAKKLIWTALGGFILALSAYLIVKEVSCFLTTPGGAANAARIYLQCGT